jgi:hypothetical protein
MLQMLSSPQPPPNQRIEMFVAHHHGAEDGVTADYQLAGRE